MISMRVPLRRREAGRTAGAPDLSGIKPLPVWFFTFEGVIATAWDVCHVWSRAWIVLAVLGGVNLLVGLTVLGRRRKLVRAMLKNSRTRTIAVALIALRAGVHLALTAVGAGLTSDAGHLALAAVMGVLTVGLLWFDQRVTFRALGLPAPGTA